MSNIYEEIKNIKITGLSKLQSRELISLALKNNRLQINLLFNILNKEIVKPYSMEKINELPIDLITNETGLAACFNDSNGVYIDETLEKEDIESVFKSISNVKLSYILEIDIMKNM